MKQAGCGVRPKDGAVWCDNTKQGTLAPLTQGDVVKVAMDMSTNKVTFQCNRSGQASHESQSIKTVTWEQRQGGVRPAVAFRKIGWQVTLHCSAMLSVFANRKGRDAFYLAKLLPQSEPDHDGLSNVPCRRVLASVFAAAQIWHARTMAHGGPLPARLDSYAQLCVLALLFPCHFPTTPGRAATACFGSPCALAICPARGPRGGCLGPGLAASTLVVCDAPPPVELLRSICSLKDSNFKWDAQIVTQAKDSSHAAAHVHGQQRGPHAAEVFVGQQPLQPPVRPDADWRHVLGVVPDRRHCGRDDYNMIGLKSDRTGYMKQAGCGVRPKDGAVWCDNTKQGTLAPLTQGDVVKVAMDMSTNKVTFSCNTAAKTVIWSQRQGGVRPAAAFRKIGWQVSLFNHNRKKEPVTNRAARWAGSAVRWVALAEPPVPGREYFIRAMSSKLPPFSALAVRRCDAAPSEVDPAASARDSPVGSSGHGSSAFGQTSGTADTALQPQYRLSVETQTTSVLEAQRWTVRADGSIVNALSGLALTALAVARGAPEFSAKAVHPQDEGCLVRDWRITQPAAGKAPSSSSQRYCRFWYFIAGSEDWPLSRVAFKYKSASSTIYTPYSLSTTEPISMGNGWWRTPLYAAGGSSDCNEQGIWIDGKQVMLREKVTEGAGLRMHPPPPPSGTFPSFSAAGPYQLSLVGPRTSWPFLWHALRHD